jgi:hypothetical protein
MTKKHKRFISVLELVRVEISSTLQRAMLAGLKMIVVLLPDLLLPNPK